MIAALIILFPGSLLAFLALAWNAPVVDEHEQEIDPQPEPSRIGRRLA